MANVTSEDLMWWLEPVLEEDAEELKETVLGAFFGGGAGTAKCQVKRGDGSVIWVRATGTAVMNADNHPTYATGILLELEPENQAASLKH